MKEFLAGLSTGWILGMIASTFLMWLHSPPQIEEGKILCQVRLDRLEYLSKEITPIQTCRIEDLRYIECKVGLETEIVTIPQHCSVRKSVWVRPSNSSSSP